jgi:polyisoprenoid-binding protein YceI
MKTWIIDQAHSEIGFTVKHLLISTVRGRFTQFSGTLTASDETFSDAKVSFSAEASSITTNNEMRDKHLHTPDFFDTEHFPMITFVSKTFKSAGDKKFVMTGDFSMRGVTKEITVDAILNGATTDAYGSRVVSFDLSGLINRTDFGVNWNAVLEAGGLSVSEDVTIEATIELKEQTAV